MDEGVLYMAHILFKSVLLTFAEEVLEVPSCLVLWVFQDWRRWGLVELLGENSRRQHEEQLVRGIGMT